ncbi:MAG: FtsW/RodA/SpoVE family cell cycle protein [Deltaproteobacteria bacterium]|nr:FtsW/RodA/SpoVE family cell cycle protein [Deltaproteobacteria bacterium]
MTEVSSLIHAIWDRDKVLSIANFLTLTSFFLLTVFGLIMITSVTYFGKEGADYISFVAKQAGGVVIGALLGLLLSRLKRAYEFNSWALPVTACILVFLPVLLEHEVRGTFRWIRLGPLNFQPGEIAKVLFIIFLSDFWGVVRKGFYRNFFAPFLVFSLLVLGFYFQKDLGGMVTVGIIFFAGLFIVLRNTLVLFFTVSIFIIFVAFSVLSEPYRVDRIKSFLDPHKDPFGSGYQAIQSFSAFREGGIFGKGLGMSSKKISSLPASHTDFIFAVIGEELGLIGCLGVVTLFFILCFGLFVRGFIFFGLRKLSILNTLSSLFIAVHAILNVMVVLGYIPTKGLPLPFISYGGSVAMSFSCLVVYTLFLKWR